MKYLIVLLPLIAVSMAQRPTYAGLSPKGYPELASRFRDPDQDATTADANNGLANRIGGDDQPAQNLPTDARGDAVLVNRLNQWPRENRPFWLINAEHIEKHRNPDGTGNIQQGQQQGSSGTQQTGLQGNGGQVQSRFAEPVGSQSRTIRPQSQRGSFAGTRS